MTPEEKPEALIAYVSEVERLAKAYALHFEGLKFLLLKKGLITGGELEEAVKTLEAAFAVEEATDPRFEALGRLRKWIENQK